LTAVTPKNTRITKTNTTEKETSKAPERLW